MKEHGGYEGKAKSLFFFFFLKEKMDFFGRTCGFQVTLKFCHVEDSSCPKQYTMDVPEFSHFLITFHFTY